MLTDVYGAKGNDLFTRGDFPPTYQNGTTESVTVDIWEKPMGPFDQGEFVFWFFGFGFFGSRKQTDSDQAHCYCSHFIRTGVVHIHKVKSSQAF